MSAQEDFINFCHCKSFTSHKTHFFYCTVYYVITSTRKDNFMSIRVSDLPTHGNLFVGKHV